ncbi:hypothetical protein BTA35_0209855 [Oceanospirillum linum]|uniref:Uncharacterized protein n=1 Tax=Oceanospirillum linum TaxID=966 RepID=A0A1T1HBT5_OCELI|nr:hypothetical protein BTA35_0209855 [Oceanospirillum linum]SEF79657.1 hypothetical protein SAMN04489856_102369 [Oleiphilus messinensis]SMP18550.1 hypothetical protein SAMN06264348_103370 [Oceanospirillum linum]
MIHFTKKAQKIDMPEGLRINSLIGGLKMSEDHLDKLRQVGEELKVPVYRMNKCTHPISGRLWEKVLISSG